MLSGEIALKITIIIINCWQRVLGSKGDCVSRFRFARMTNEREEPAEFGLIGTPKARAGMETKLFQSVFKAEVIVRSNASARASTTEIRQDLGIRIGMR